jgi:glycosyltransferase involved in cell wall biosynthesis
MKEIPVVRSKYASVIIPVYNEEENVPLLHERIHQVLKKQDFSYEIIYVDDGSKDGTYSQLREVAQKDEHVRVIRFRRNFGQTAAMAAGVEQSTGEILIFMDGDLQNDPIDIPRMLAKMEEGYDVVSGWRKDRQDAQISRKLPSRIANRLISRVTGVQLHDYGCTLKAYRYEVFQHIRLYGEMHRFIPAYAALAGASITEVPVTHHARQFGVSKYGISRVFRVVLDLVTIKFLGRYGTRPAHAFGMVGLGSLTLAGSSSAIAIGRQITAPRTSRGLFWSIALLFTGFGLLSVMMGLIGEMLMRTYYEGQGKPTYVIRETTSKRDAAASEHLVIAKDSNVAEPMAK